MSVKKDANGRRSVQVEVEVPGTPEQVWQAIATGPGVGAWFVPTEVDGRIGGTVTSHFGGGMDSVKTITEWDAPHRFAAEGSWGPNTPTVATEWIVEARGGGTCIVRVVHSLFAETDDWDNQLTGVESGWPSFFSILRLYLEHFAGQPSSQIQLLAMPAASGAWEKLAGALNLAGAAPGGRRCPSIERHRGVTQYCRESTHAVTRRSARSGCGVCHRVPRRRESIRHSELLSLRRHGSGRRGARPVRLDCVDDESLPGVNPQGPHLAEIGRA